MKVLVRAERAPTSHTLYVLEISEFWYLGLSGPNGEDAHAL